MPKAEVRPSVSKLKPIHITPRQYEILLTLLRERRPLSPKQIGGKLNLAPKAYHPPIRNLMARALLTRVPEDHGEVRLSAGGRALLLAAMVLVGASR